MSHSPIETQCVIFDSLYHFQPISKKKKKKKQYISLSIHQPRASCGVSLLAVTTLSMKGYVL